MFLKNVFKNWIFDCNYNLLQSNSVLFWFYTYKVLQLKEVVTFRKILIIIIIIILRNKFVVVCKCLGGRDTINCQMLGPRDSSWSKCPGFARGGCSRLDFDSHISRISGQKEFWSSFITRLISSDACTYTKMFAGEKGTKHADQRDSVASWTLYSYF